MQLILYRNQPFIFLSFHSNNNFSRKDKVDIQKKVTQKLIIADKWTGFVNDRIKDPLLLSSFHTLISAISTPFNLCNSEYFLNK